MNKIILLTAGIALVVVVGIGAYLSYYKSQIAESPSTDKVSETINSPEDDVSIVQNENAVEQSEQKPLVIRGIEQEYEADFANSSILVGGSHNIFVAKIIKKVSSKSRLSTPKTQFEAEIIYNIKGNLLGRVIIDQTGGYLNGVLYAVLDGINYGDIAGPASPSDEVKYLLQPGLTYLLPTRYSQRDDWYTVNSFPRVTKLISDNSNLSNDQLRTLAENDSRAKNLLMVYPNETPLASDIRNNTTLNSFQSLSPEEKQAVYDKIASFSRPPGSVTSTATSTQ